MDSEQRFRYRRQYDYDAFVAKFQGKKEDNTDECYTPVEMYECVLEWVDKYYPLAGKRIVRPFYPGGDYKAYNYQSNDVVIDNPPFSIYSDIVRFYVGRNIPFFLWGPQKSLFLRSSILDVTYLPIGIKTKFHNGALIDIGFVSNMFGKRAIWIPRDLVTALWEKKPKQKRIIKYPDNIISSVLCEKYRFSDISIDREEVLLLDNTTFQRVFNMHECGFGRHFLLTPSGAAKIARANKKKLDNVLEVKLKTNKWQWLQCVCKNKIERIFYFIYIEMLGIRL